MNYSQENGISSDRKINFLVWQGNAEIECGGDFIIPDAKKDIKKVLWSEFRPEEQRLTASEGIISAKGSVRAMIVYLAEDATLSFCDFLIPYEKDFSAPGVAAGSDVFWSGSVAERSVKPINSRKIRLSAVLRAFLFVFSEENAVPALRGLPASSLSTVRERKSAAKNSFLTAARSVSVPVTADLEVGSAQPAPGEITAGEITVVPVSAEAEENGVRMTYECRFSFLCSGENGNYYPMKKKIRQTETIEVPGCSPGDRVFLTASAGELKSDISENSFGEKRVIEADAVCSFTLSVYREEETLLTEDLYSTVYPTGEVTEKGGKTVLFLRTVSSGYSDNVSFPKEECGAKGAVSVVDCHASAMVSGIEADPERQKISVSGKLFLSALTVEAGEDGSALPGIASAETPFRCELDAGTLPDAENVLPVSLSVTECVCRMDAGKLYFDTELYFSAPVFSFSTRRYVTEAAFSEVPAERGEMPTVILCYPTPGETLWEIAKKYRSSTDALLTVNRMTEKDLPKKKVLLIPTDAV